jgi:pre-mRNA-processing factor 40
VLHRSSFSSTLSDNDTSDPRFQASAAMSESDRELHFSDFVIELQAAEDEKRRRIRDARRRAEKVQREEYGQMLNRFAKEGTVLPSTKWRNIEDLVSVNAAFGPVKSQDREAPRQLFQDFADAWNDVYRRDRSFLARLVQPLSSKGVSVTIETTYEDFSKALLNEAAYSPEQYSDIRQILNHEDPISSARLYFNDLHTQVKESASTAMTRNSRRGSVKDDSSEDEGEIIEDGEIDGDGNTN